MSESDENSESNASSVNKKRKAFVLGGSGSVGREVLRGLKESGVETRFTYNTGAETARELEKEYELKAYSLDLADKKALSKLAGELEAEDWRPDIFIHCAALSQARSLEDISEEDWQKLMTVNCWSAFNSAQVFAPSMLNRGGGDMVFLGALDRSQSLPIPIHFAATQGLLSGMTMALARELGAGGLRVNMIAFGMLEEGLSREMEGGLGEAYLKFSALGRRGTTREAADAVLWLALKNTYMNGKVVSVNGGI